MKNWEKIFVELQEGECSMQTVLINREDVENKPDILNKVYHSTFDILDKKATFLVVELLDADDITLISIKMEPNTYELSEVVELLTEKLENGEKEI